MSSKTFTGAVVVAALAWSSSVSAQAGAQEPLNQAAQLLGTIAASLQSDAGRLIATLKQDFTDFASTYLAPARAAGGTPAAIGTSGVAGAPPDWRAKYRRVEADLAALLGPSSEGPPRSGGVALDQATRAQLEMVRSHLQLFYAATMSAPDGNPVAHTGAPQISQTPSGIYSRPPVAPTGEAPQTPPAATAQPAAAAGGPTTAPVRTSIPQVETDLGMALTLLDRMQRILDDATAEPGKLKLDRASVDEIRAEIQQIRSTLRARQR